MWRGECWEWAEAGTPNTDEQDIDPQWMLRRAGKGGNWRLSFLECMFRIASSTCSWQECRQDSMAIRKQEFYEGAALHLIARTGQVSRIRYDAPFFLLNDRLSVLLKYSTKGRSPWGFTFTADEQILLETRASEFETTIALICGADGVAAISYDSYTTVASRRQGAVHIACYRRYGEHYEVNGPDGTLRNKIAPSTWQKILDS